MPTPKKSLLACVSAAALVASFGFVQAQSSDQDAAAMANVNGGVDRGEDARSYPSDNLAANSGEMAYEAPAAGPAEPATSPWAADVDNSQSTVTAQAPAADSGQAAGTSGYQPNVGIDGTPGIPEGSAGQRSSVYDPAAANGTAPLRNDNTATTPSTSTTGTAAPTDYNAMPPTAAGTPAAAAPSSDSNMTVTSAPETRIDLNSPSEPLYNLPGGERAPRPDRN